MSDRPTTPTTKRIRVLRTRLGTVSAGKEYEVVMWLGNNPRCPLIKDDWHLGCRLTPSDTDWRLS